MLSWDFGTTTALALSAGSVIKNPDMADRYTVRHPSNRSMVPVFTDTGMRVRYVESRDGHSWENWRDRLRDGLSYVFPGPRKYVYE